MQKIKVVIFGSCVTRDAVADASSKIALVEYFARSSLAGFGSAPDCRGVSLDGIDSSFQKKILSYELGKEAVSRLEKLDCDFILIDLIDERFDLLASDEGEKVFTLSNEMLNTDIERLYSDFEKVSKCSDKYFLAWEKGWSRLVAFLKEKEILSKLMVSEVYWAKTDIVGEGFNKSYTNSYIDESNNFLSRLYKRMAVDLAENQFIRFSKDKFIANEQHRWGRSPFHYIDELYEELILNVILHYRGKHNFLTRQLLSLPFGNDVKIFSYSQAGEDEYFPALHLFYNDIFSEKLNYIVQSSLSTEEMRLVSPISGKEMRFLGNSHIAGRNFLFFDDGYKLAVLVQHHKFCRALYYPTQRRLIKFDSIDLPNSCFDELYSFIKGKVSLYENYFSLEKGPSCIGLFISYGRPYHYFYDTLPAALKYKDFLKPVHKVVSVASGEFFPAHSIFGKDETLLFEDYEKTTEYLLEQGKYFILPGYANRRGEEITSFDNSLVDLSRDLSEKNHASIIDKLASAKNVFWFGICSEKRYWAEQVPLIRSLISEILEADPEAMFIFDGLTSPVSINKERFQSEYCDAELKTLVQITADLVCSAQIINLIGDSAELKICCASYVTVFLTSFLTDSIYVARFNKCRGVAYGASKAMHTDHFHPNTWFVPKTWVVDDERKSRNWSEISYSINPDLVKSLFLAVWKEQELYVNLKALADAKNGVVFKLNESGITVSADTGPRHILVPIERSELCVRSGKGALVRFLGSVQRDFSVSVLVTVTGGGIFNSSKTYLSVGQTFYLPPSTKVRNVKFSLRVKGKGEANLVKLGLTHMDIPEEKVAYEAIAPSGPKKLTSFSELSGLIKESYYLQDYCYVTGGGKLDFRYARNGSRNLLVFFHAALTRSLSAKMPAFAGNNAIGVIDANILMISDPSITNENKLSLAWYAGSEYFDSQDKIKCLIESIIAVDSPERIVFYGGSGGGFASLYYGDKFPHSFSICANPQTDISRYSSDAVKKYLDECFPSILEGSLLERLVRTNVGYQVRADRQRNKVIYLQNTYDGHHIENHLKPFLGDIADIENNIWKKDILVYLSSNWGKGHAAPPRKMIFDLLKYVFSDDYHHEALPDNISALDAAHSSLIYRVSLIKDSSVLKCKIEKSLVAIEGSVKYAFYLLRNGVRIEYIPYSGASDAEFIIGECHDGDFYQAVGFVRDGGQTSTLKSNKIFF